MLKLHVVIASTRPQRVGPKFAAWFVEQAKKQGTFEVRLVDLKEVALPLLDEPNHPRLAQYTQEHTKAWSATVAAADAFVFVTPEYNYGVAAPLVNAVDYLYNEWNYKPAGFVSYGGQSGGVRGVQAAKAKLTSVKVMPIPEAVAVPFYPKALDEQGNFPGGSAYDAAALAMLNELHRWAKVLAPLHAPAA